MRLLTELAHLFVCMHPNQTFPQTRSGQTTVCCLDCGAEFEYDWNNGRRGKKLRSTLNVERPN